MLQHSAYIGVALQDDDWGTLRPRVNSTLHAIGQKHYSWSEEAKIEQDRVRSVMVAPRGTDKLGTKNLCPDYNVTRCPHKNLTWGYVSTYLCFLPCHI